MHRRRSRIHKTETSCSLVHGWS